MRLVDAFGTLASLEAPSFTTRDAAARLRVPHGHASASLARLRAAGLVVRLRRGVWALPSRVDPLALPECLTAPLPAYVSLHSALYLHGMISQVPAVTYAVTLARTRRFVTPARDRVAASREAGVLLRLRGRRAGRRPSRHAGEGPRRLPVPHAGPVPAVSSAPGGRMAEGVQAERRPIDRETDRAVRQARSRRPKAGSAAGGEARTIAPRRLRSRRPPHSMPRACRSHDWRSSLDSNGVFPSPLRLHGFGAPTARLIALISNPCWW